MEKSYYKKLSLLYFHAIFHIKWPWSRYWSIKNDTPLDLILFKRVSSKIISWERKISRKYGNLAVVKNGSYPVWNLGFVKIITSYIRWTDPNIMCYDQRVKSPKKRHVKYVRRLDYSIQGPAFVRPALGYWICTYQNE